MSKLIESLKASARGFSKTNYEMTQQQLADVYFSGSDKLKKSDQPLVIKVIERPRPSSTVPWIIASIAFLLLALSLFSTKRVFIDVKIIDEKHPYLVPSSHGDLESSNTSAGPAQTPENGSEIRFGDKLPLQDFVFEGAAKLQSSKDKSQLTLVNSSVAPFARASLYLKSPLNLQAAKVVFFAKGGRGGENLSFSIKDKDNLAAFRKGRLYPFENALTTDWQKAEISVANTEGKFNNQNIASLRFDIGSKDTENKPGDTVFIRDLQIVPA